MVFRLGNYTLDIDVEKTRAFYDRPDIFTAGKVCECIDCQNFDKAILTSSDTVLDFLRSLGIDPQKPTEIYNVIGDLEEAGTVWYNGWYYVCGTVLALPESFQERKQNDNYLWENGYLPERDLPFLVLPMLSQDLLHEEFPLPAIQLFVDTHLPYVLPCAYTRQVRTIIVEDPRE